MAEIAAVVTKVIGTGAQMVGYQQAADSARVAGQRQNVEAQFEAQQLEQMAGQSIAAAQRDAQEEKRKAEILSSRALAVAGASGAGASDPTVVRIIAGLKGEGSYRSMVAMYGGEEQARRLRMGAAGKRYEGAIAEETGIQRESAYKIQSAASLFDGGTDIADFYVRKKDRSLMEKYGGYK